MLHFLHATADIPADGDPIALAIVLVVLAAFAVWTLIAKRQKGKSEPQALPTEAAPTPPKAVAPGTAGQLKLHDVEPKTAAMLMAIVADKLGKPINELRFISIKEVK